MSQGENFKPLYLPSPGLIRVNCLNFNPDYFNDQTNNCFQSQPPARQFHGTTPGMSAQYIDIPLHDKNSTVIYATRFILIINELFLMLSLLFLDTTPTGFIIYENLL